MAVTQFPIVVPPVDSDKKLTDYSHIIQKNLAVLFGLAHSHLGRDGIVTNFPAANQGAPGDILVGIVGGIAYLFFKVSDKDWYKISGTHV